MIPNREQSAVMKLIGKNRLRELYGHDDQTDKWLRSWVSELSHANWKHAKDVLRQFPRVQSFENNVFLFPVGQRQQSIEVTMMFPQAIALIVSLTNKLQ